MVEDTERLIPSMEGFIAAVCSITLPSLSLPLSLPIHIFASVDAVYVLVFLMIATNLHSTQVSKSLDTLVNCCMQCALRYIIVYL